MNAAEERAPCSCGCGRSVKPRPAYLQTPPDKQLNPFVNGGRRFPSQPAPKRPSLKTRAKAKAKGRRALAFTIRPQTQQLLQEHADARNVSLQTLLDDLLTCWARVATDTQVERFAEYELPEAVRDRYTGYLASLGFAPPPVDATAGEIVNLAFDGEWLHDR